MRCAALLLTAWFATGGMLLWAQSNPPPRQPQQNGAAPNVNQPPAQEYMPPAKPDGVLHFEPANLQMRLEQGRWVLREGNTLVKDFGTDAVTARATLQVIQQQHLTELVWVGKPIPSLEFFLRDNQAPRAMIANGLTPLTFQPQELKVAQIAEFWWVAEDKRPLICFGTSRSNAERALDLIRQYQFNQISYLERPPAPLVVLAAGAPQVLQQKLDGGKKATPKLTSDKSPFAPPEQPQRKPELMDAFERIAFDYSQVKLRQVDRHWQLFVGRHVLKDFGENEHDAREALKAVQFFRFTEQFHLTDADAEENFEFYLAIGQPPRGRILGQTGLAFHAKDLSIRQTDGAGWIVAERETPLLRFNSRDHAEKAVEAIRRYQFDRIFLIGRPESGMMFFSQGF